MPLDASAASGAAAAAIAVGEDVVGAGLLVAQILETKKELEDGRRNAFSPETPGHRRVPIVSTSKAKLSWSFFFLFKRSNVLFIDALIILHYQSK